MKGRLGVLRVGRMMAWLGAFAAMSVMTAVAQGPGGMGSGMGMGPHRPPMEREMGGSHGQFGRWWNNARLVEKFKLTDPQRKTMDGIYEQHRLNLVDLHANLEKAELEMEPLMGQDQPDEAKILSQIDKVAQARAELEKANARMLLDIRKQLTPEQWKDVKTAWADRRDGRGGPGAPGDGQHWHRRDGAPKDGGAAPLPQPGGPGPGEE